MRKLSTAVAGIVAIASIAAGAPAAYAGSSGTGLDGTDPVATNCWRTQVAVGHQTYWIVPGYHYAEVRIMYSRKCGTVWLDYWMLEVAGTPYGELENDFNGAIVSFGRHHAPLKTPQHTPQIYAPGDDPVDLHLSASGDNDSIGQFDAHCAHTCEVRTVL